MGVALAAPRSGDGNVANSDSIPAALACASCFGRRKRLHRLPFVATSMCMANLRHRSLLAVEGTMNPGIQVVLNLFADLFSDFLGLGERHQDEYPRRNGILLALIFLVILGLVGLIICGGLAYR